MSVLQKIKEMYGALNDENISNYLRAHKVTCGTGIKYPFFQWRVGISTISINEFGEILEYYANTTHNN